MSTTPKSTEDLLGGKFAIIHLHTHTHTYWQLKVCQYVCGYLSIIITMQGLWFDVVLLLLLFVCSYK